MDGRALEFRAEPARLRRVAVRLAGITGVVLLLLLIADVGLSHSMGKDWRLTPYFLLIVVVVVIAQSRYVRYRRFRIEPDGIDDGADFFTADELVGPPLRRSTGFGGEELRIPVRQGLQLPWRFRGIERVPLEAYAPEERDRLVEAVVALVETQRQRGAAGDFSAAAMTAAMARRELRLPYARTFPASLLQAAVVILRFIVVLLVLSLVARGIVEGPGADPAVVLKKTLADALGILIPLGLLSFMRFRGVELGPTTVRCGYLEFQLVDIVGPVELEAGAWWREPRIAFEHDRAGIAGGGGRRQARRRVSIPVGQLVPADRIDLYERLATIARGPIDDP